MVYGRDMGVIKGDTRSSDDSSCAHVCLTGLSCGVPCSFGLQESTRLGFQACVFILDRGISSWRVWDGLFWAQAAAQTRQDSEHRSQHLREKCFPRDSS